MFVGTLFALASNTTYVGESRKKKTIQHTKIRSTLERFLPASLVVGLGRPWLVIVIHGTNVESSCVLDVDSGGSCRIKGLCSVGSVGKGTF